MEYAVKVKTQQRHFAEKVSIPASLFPATFSIVVIHKDTKMVYFTDGDENFTECKDFGKYLVEVIVDDAMKKHEAKAKLIVQNKEPFAYWEN